MFKCRIFLGVISLNWMLGYVPGQAGISQGGRDSDKDAVILRWSTPKTMALDLQYCPSVYRVTPADVSKLIQHT